MNFNLVGHPNAVLVVSSYEAVNWNIKLGAGASLAKVIVLGYKTSTATAPNGVVVINETPLSSKYCSHYSSSADACIPYAKTLAGGGENAGMWGCYNASSFVIQ